MRRTWLGLVIRGWLAARRTPVITAVSCATVAALIVTVAVVSGGYAAGRMQLGDAAVWVTSQTKHMLGRANTEIAELNSVVPGTDDSLDVVQSDTGVLLVDHGSNTVGIVDPATSEVGKGVALPARGPAVDLVGDRVAVSSRTTGQVWLMPMNALRDFDTQSPPTVDLGGKIVAATDPAGRFFAYSAGAGSVYRIDAATQDTIAATDPVRVPDKSDAVQISAVGGQWALLDSTASELFLPEGRVKLPGWLGTATVIQQASDSGDRVYVASPSGLVAVSRDGNLRTVLRGSLGTPAAPAVADGCAYAAWSAGTVWKACGDAVLGTRSALSTVPAGATLAFRASGHDVVLNDTTSGMSWAVQHGNKVIDNWADFARENPTKQTTEDNTEDTPPTFEKDQQPPVAVDDVFGARPGKVSSLPVLQNDYDPNGDVLVISSIEPPPALDGTIDLVNNDQQLQLTLPQTASGSFAFHYTITDGKGGSATAAVTVHVRTPEENSPPVQVRTTKATVQTGGRVSTQVLGDWYDPDGDPIYLSGASVADGSTASATPASFTPEGTVVYSDGGSGASMVNVALTVSDGTASAGGSLAVTVRAPGKVPIIAEPFVVTTTAGTETLVNPLAHVRGGSGPLRLSTVPSASDAVITPDYDAGTFRFSSGTVGEHPIDFAVTDGVTTANGTVRIVVKAPPEGKTRPITVPHTAFIQEQSSRDVDVLATDIDPAGGVLLVTGVSGVPPASGMRVEILQQNLLRVTLTRPLTSPTAFAYQISNGLADAQGTVTVVQIPRPDVSQPPVANPDSVSVRVGDAIDIPVLANDSQPDGDDLTLHPTLATPLPPGAGLLFVSGNVLRYLAPKKPGNYTADYRVDAPDGQWATARVTIAVRELDAQTNSPPVPQTVTARVLAGEKVRIPIPLGGIDPDGDSVKLVGQDTNPNKGAVTSVGTDSIQYQAGEYSTGLDTFNYTVVDALGARASGTVRVGIAAASSGARNPVAVEDEATTRPGRSVAVQVLANDSDPDNSPLKITSVHATTSSSAKAHISGDVVRITAPRTEGRYGFVYEIQNQTGGTSSNFITLVVSKDAPLARPDVSDTILDLSDILGKRSVTVDVLANVFFADGPVDSLDLKVMHGYADAATVTSGKRVRVQVRAQSQIIPFSVTHPDDASVVSYGFVWVPGTDDARPQLKRGADKLSVQSESPLTIHLNDYVVAVGGKKVRLTDSSTVHATHANGDDLVRDGDTLVYTSAARYFGPASISFEVTDGDSAADPKGRVATLVLPITVTPRENQPPAFTGGQIDFEPGQNKTIDLVKLTRYPYAKDQGELAYRVLEPKPDGFTVSLDGTKLTIRTDDQTKKGRLASVLIGVRDSVNDGQSGRIDLAVVPSTRPIAVPAPDSAIVRRGQSTTVDVLANDGAGNPFPASPLRVVAVRGIDGGSLPAGVSVTPSADNSRLTVSVAADAEAKDSTLQYEVADATGDPDRYAWGSVRISVQDRPDPIANLHAAGFSDRSITMAWAPGASGNSPIIDYQVTLTRASNGQVVGTTTCAATTCAIQTPGNGPDNSVNVAVTARNAIGVSDPVSYGEALWSDVVPAAPTGLSSTPLDHGLRVTWHRPPDVSGASAITSYVVSVGGISRVMNVSGGDALGTSYAMNITDASIGNGASIGFSVASRNDYYGGTSSWNHADASGVPAGPPIAVGTPSATPDANTGTAVTMAWPGVFSENGTSITAYYAAAYTGNAPNCTVTGVEDGAPQLRVDSSLRRVDGTSTTFTGLRTNTNYSFIVYAYNGQGCSAAPVVAATTHKRPGTPTAINASLQSSSDTTWDYQLNGVTYESSGGAPATIWNYRLNGDFATETGSLNGPGFLNPGGAHYGKATSVSVQVCESYRDGTGLCSDWSKSFDLGVPVSAQLGGLRYDRSTKQFQWTSWPTGSYASVTYSCDSGVTNSPMPAAGSVASCQAPGGLLGDTLTVTVTVGTTPYRADYASRNYD
jgi:hypothetical protein